jgi:hypothetical protein
MFIINGHTGDTNNTVTVTQYDTAGNFICQATANYAKRVTVLGKSEELG